MRVIISINHLPRSNLPTNNCIRHPRVLQNLAHLSARFWVEIEHAPNDMPAFPGQQSKDTPRAADDFLLFAAVLARRPLLLALGLFRRRLSFDKSSLRRVVQSGHGCGWWKNELLRVVTRRWIGSKELERAIGKTGKLPGEASERHAAVDDGQRPDIHRLWVVLLFVVDLRRKIWI